MIKSFHLNDLPVRLFSALSHSMMSQFRRHSFRLTFDTIQQHPWDFYTESQKKTHVEKVPIWGFFRLTDQRPGNCDKSRKSRLIKLCSPLKPQKIREEWMWMERLFLVEKRFYSSRLWISWFRNTPWCVFTHYRALTCVSISRIPWIGPSLFRFGSNGSWGNFISPFFHQVKRWTIFLLKKTMLQMDMRNNAKRSIWQVKVWLEYGIMFYL